MSAVNSMVIDIVEKILEQSEEIDDAKLFEKLMDNLLTDTKKFYADYKDIIPKKFHPFFKS